LSNMSIEDGVSVRSRRTSVASDAESSRSRERGWNQPNPHLRPPAPRQRTSSGSAIPTSPGFGRPGMQSRADSANSSHSRSSSRVSFLESDREPAPPAVHERERNWNSPQPKWFHHSPGSRASKSPTSSEKQFSPAHALTEPRTRAESLQPSPSLKNTSPSYRERVSSLGRRAALRHTLSSPQIGGASPTTSPSRLPVSSHRLNGSPFNLDRRSYTSPARAETPDLSDYAPADQSPGLSSRVAWRFPRSMTPLAPMEHEDSPERPPVDLPEADEEELVPTRPTTPLDEPHPFSKIGRPSRPPSRASLAIDTHRSRIPVISPQKHESLSPNSPRGSRGHKRASAEFSTAVGGIPPRVQKINAELTAAVKEAEDEAKLQADEKVQVHNTEPSPAMPDEDELLRTYCEHMLVIRLTSSL
jgi:serine/arginine repetitive matrix protein 2